jgi:hypothetical protein
MKQYHCLGSALPLITYLKDDFLSADNSPPGDCFAL